MYMSHELCMQGIKKKSVNIRMYLYINLHEPRTMHMRHELCLQGTKEICQYTHVFIHKSMYNSTRACLWVCVYVCVCVCVCVCVFKCVCVCVKERERVCV